VIPASQIGPSNAGTVAVTVSNPTPGGGTSNSLSFQIVQANPIPSIASINPSSVPISFTTPSIVTITGTNFQQGAVLSFINGSSQFYLAATFVSSTQLTFNSTGYFSNTGVYTLYVVDPSPGGYSNPVSFTVTGPPDFSITSTGTTTQAVNAGQTATFTNAISVTAQNSFASQVNLACSLPVTAKHTTCTVSPNMLTSGSGTASVSVTTMANGLVPPTLPTGRLYLRPELVALLLLTLLLAILMLRIARTRRVRLVGALSLATLVLFILLQAIGCGGGSSTPPPPPPPTGTPAGTYTVTVTGTASTSNGTLTHTTTSLTLTVN